MKLSILIPTVHTRYKNFLPNIQEQLYSQYDNLTEQQQKEVEILFLSDTKSIMLGDKRNMMMNIATGDYISFVDDDDRLSDDYILSLLNATENKTDVICFLASVSLNGDKPKICDYSIAHKVDHNTSDKYNRIPNHICCVKKELAIKVQFPPKLYGEDSAYSKKLLPLIKSEHKINKVLYHYDYNQNTTETQMHLKPRVDNVDLVILSNAKNWKLQQMTENTISSALMGSKGYKVNIIVMEQNKAVRYSNAKTIYLDDPFNYNKFANIGASEGSASWIFVANNDLKFTEGWLKELLKANHPIVSPKCPRDIRQVNVRENEKGYICGRNFSGWAFMIQRSLWLEIGGFNEDFTFYCADNVVIEQLRSVNIEPMLVPRSNVYHLVSSTLNTESNSVRDNLTFEQVDKFNKAYNRELFKDNKSFLEWKERR